jgi:hypothetical protein
MLRSPLHVGPMGARAVCARPVTPEERHLFSVAAEYVHGLAPQRSRFGMWAIIITADDARGICRTVMRHHRVVPGGKAGRQRKSLRRTCGISD